MLKLLSNAEIDLLQIGFISAFWYNKRFLGIVVFNENLHHSTNQNSKKKQL